MTHPCFATLLSPPYTFTFCAIYPIVNKDYYISDHHGTFSRPLSDST
ncbi:hypothetical protein T4D_10292 [Trichinella pseudospiralis]|uniref:Uncharacterized protein n=1 Tax=Trichinella pseudospiralis TaxID=6337 RepID=A0A0V1EM85_TRIPS|nr:hypothetical protein T4D_10292 [Trichinella pseudospiralis]